MGPRWAKRKFWGTVLALLGGMCLIGTLPVIIGVATGLTVVAGARELHFHHELSRSGVLMSCFLEEITPLPVRYTVSLLESGENLFHTNFLSAIIPLLMVSIFQTFSLSLVMRFLMHYFYDLFLLEAEFNQRPAPTDYSQIPSSMVYNNYGVYYVPELVPQSMAQIKGLTFDGERLKLPQFIKPGSRQYITSGRATFQIDTTKSDPLIPDDWEFKKGFRPVGAQAGPHFGAIGGRSGAMTVSAVNLRIAPPRIERTSPIIRWYDAYHRSKLRKNSLLYKRFSALEEVCLYHGIDMDVAFNSYVEGEEVNPDVDYQMRRIEAFQKNTFSEVLEEYFLGEKSSVDVKPCTLRELLENKESRTKAKYLNEWARRELTQADLDSVLWFTPDSAKMLFDSSWKDTPIFVKDEKYGMKKQRLTPEFMELCAANGLFPDLHMVDEMETIKPRVISAEKLGPRIEGGEGGQFLLLFYGSSVKKAVKEVLFREREVIHSVDGVKRKIRFDFITDTSSDSVSQSFREAMARAEVSNVITALIHGDDSLIIFPEKGKIFLIECDYSSYDTTQGDDAINAEHKFYDHHCEGLPKSFIEHSLNQHGYPFTFEFGREYKHEQDFIKVRVILEELMRHSGAWNTTTGNSLVSAMAILYNLEHMSFDDIGRPKFDAYSDLALVVKPAAFHISEDPHTVTFLKMAPCLNDDGEWTMCVLPSQALRMGMVLSMLPTHKREDGTPVYNRDLIETVRAETCYGLRVPYDYPVLGPFTRSEYIMNLLKLSPLLDDYIDQYDRNNLSGADGDSPTMTVTNAIDLLVARGVRGTYSSAGSNFYTFSKRFGGVSNVSRASVLEMMVKRYDTTEQEVIELERKMTCICGQRSILICDPLAIKMSNKDYGTEHNLFSFSRIDG